MIAPLPTKHEPGSHPVSRRLVAARAVIAAMLLPSAETQMPPIRAWKAWLFIAWLAITLVVYALVMSGLAENLTG